MKGLIFLFTTVNVEHEQTQTSHPKANLGPVLTYAVV